MRYTNRRDRKRKGVMCWNWVNMLFTITFRVPISIAKYLCVYSSQMKSFFVKICLTIIALELSSLWDISSNLLAITTSNWFMLFIDWFIANCNWAFCFDVFGSICTLIEFFEVSVLNCMMISSNFIHLLWIVPGFRSN